MYSLTPAKRKALDFIASYIATSGTSPTVREIQAALGYRSTQSAQTLVAGLVERGAVRKLSRRPRSLTIAEAA